MLDKVTTPSMDSMEELEAWEVRVEWEDKASSVSKDRQEEEAIGCQEERTRIM